MKSHLFLFVLFPSICFAQARQSEKILEKLQAAHKNMSAMTGLACSPNEQENQLMKAKICAGDYQTACALGSHPEETVAPIQKAALAAASKQLGVQNILEEIRKSTEVRFSLLGVKVMENWSTDLNSNRLKDYAAIINASQREVYKKLATSGINESTIRARVKALQKSIITRVSQTKAFTNGAGLSAQNIENQLSKIKLVMADDLQPNKEGNLSAAQGVKLQDFFDNCGIDGLTTQAFYDSGDNTMVICPGFLFNLLKQKNVFPLDLAIGHEEGHSFDPNVEDSLAKTFHPYLSCIVKNYSPQLTKAKDVGNFMRSTGVSRLRAALAALKKQKPLDLEKILYFERRVARIDDMEEQIDDADNENAIESMQGELSADLNGAETIATQTALLPLSDRLSAVTSSVNIFCAPKAFQEALDLLVGNAHCDGIHPPNPLRIELILKNPRIQKTLGCPRLTSSQAPSCSIEGASR